MNKKNLIIIAFKDFQDQEYLLPKKIIEDSGFKTETISNKKGIAIGVFGETVEINKTIEEIDIKNYRSIIFVGGGGCLPYLDNEKSYKLIQEAEKNKKIIGAICISPVILAKAGILKNKRATVWNSPMDQFPVKTIEREGAYYKANSVVVDNNIITARGPEVADLFGEKIVELLTKK
jgi:protease I